MRRQKREEREKREERREEREEKRRRRERSASFDRMRRFIGEVVSTRMQKTAVVLVERFRKNARLDKWVKYRKKFKVSKPIPFSFRVLVEAKPKRKKNQ